MSNFTINGTVISGVNVTQSNITQSSADLAANVAIPLPPPESVQKTNEIATENLSNQKQNQESPALVNDAPSATQAAHDIGTTTLDSSELPTIKKTLDSTAETAPKVEKTENTSPEASTEAPQEAAQSLYEKTCTWFSNAKDSMNNAASHLSDTAKGYYDVVTNKIDETTQAIKSSETAQTVFGNPYIAAVAPALPIAGGLAAGFMLANGTIHALSAGKDSFKEARNIKYFKTMDGAPVKPRVSKLQAAVFIPAGVVTFLAANALSNEASKVYVWGATAASALATALITLYTNPMKHESVAPYRLLPSQLRAPSRLGG